MAFLLFFVGIFQADVFNQILASKMGADGNPNLTLRTKFLLCSWCVLWVEQRTRSFIYSLRLRKYKGQTAWAEDTQVLAEVKPSEALGASWRSWYRIEEYVPHQQHFSALAPIPLFTSQKLQCSWLATAPTGPNLLSHWCTFNQMWAEYTMIHMILIHYVYYIYVVMHTNCIFYRAVVLRFSESMDRSLCHCWLDYNVGKTRSAQ